MPTETFRYYLAGDGPDDAFTIPWPERCMLDASDFAVAAAEHAYTLQSPDQDSYMHEGFSLNLEHPETGEWATFDITVDRSPTFHAEEKDES